MTYEAFASALPPQRRITFTSVEENEEALRRLGVNQEMRQLGKGRFRSCLAVRSTEQCDLYSDRFSKACWMSLEPPAGTVGLLIIRSAKGRVLASGRNVANDKLLVLPSGSGIDLVIPDLTGSEAMTIPEARFSEMTELLCPGCVPPERMVVIEGDTPRLHALRDNVLDMVAGPEPNPDPERLSSLLASTIAWMGDAASQWRPEGFRFNDARGRVARRAQAFIEEHYREAVRIEELCRVTGVGVRTLQRCFLEYFDLTISDYLKVVRLNAAHRELVAADAAHDTITEIAPRHGFTHLGRFSVEFRERFGESPRRTLARR